MLRDEKQRFAIDNSDIGKKYGKLTILRLDKRQPNGQYYALCKCDCGNLFTIRKTLVTTGKQTACRQCSLEKRKGKKKENVFVVNGDITEIHLGSGKIAFIDTEDLEKVKQHYWSMSNSSRYVSSYTAKPNTLHHFVFNEDAPLIDHKDGNPLNNLKENLRKCTYRQNSINRKRRIDNKTGVTGVQKRFNKYVAIITIEGKRMQKTFNNFEDAVVARRDWENKYFGEWVRGTNYDANLS